MDNSIAVMQPYFFPYIGYFQLISTVNKFVFYDDVDFIKNGWINRNKILINNEAKYLTIPCKDASSFKKIYDVNIILNERTQAKKLKQVKFAYANAPFFDSVYPLVEKVLNLQSRLVVDLAIQSIKQTCRYLKLNTIFKRSSKHYNNTELRASERLIHICKKEGNYNYINPSGGTDLYDQDEFRLQGINLYFLDPTLRKYQQFNNEFVGGLSIIDVMMFNSPEKIRTQLLTDYKLV